MPGFSSVVLVGHLTRDPELRYTGDGKPVANFSVAVNNRFTKASGEKAEEVSFVDVTAWNRLAEICAEFLKKGRAVLVCGRLAQDHWEDPTTHQKRSKLRVVAGSVQFLGGGSKDEEPDPEADASAEAAPAPPASKPLSRGPKR